jgi:HEAT repeat protein
MLNDTTADAFYRSSVADALGEISPDRAFEPLVQLLKDKASDSHLRSRSANALAEIAPDKAVKPLVQLLKDKTADSRLRSHVVDKLNAIAMTEAHLSLLLSAHQSPMFARAKEDLLRVIETVDRKLRAQKPVE